MYHYNDAAQQALFAIIAGAQTPQAVQAIVDAFLTESERHEVINRLRIFTLLAQGHTQRDIAEKLGVGIATVSRGARAYQQHKIDALLPHLRTLSLNSETTKERQ